MSFGEKMWKCRDREVDLSRPLIMGILNVTPDSFSDGGKFFDPKNAVKHALEMIEDGAEIIDIGGESTRPGSLPVSDEEQIQRTIPVIKALAEKSNCLISIDTMSSVVANAALSAGAHIINDVSGFERDPEMVNVAASFQAGSILMHMQGLPETMQNSPKYESSVVSEVFSHLKSRAEIAEKAGLSKSCIMLDPGIGFGKEQEHNLALLRATAQLKELGYPVLIGASRKSLVGYLTGRSIGDRLAGSLAIAAYAAEQGADVLRVHDVKETCDLLTVLRMLSGNE